MKRPAAGGNPVWRRLGSWPEMTVKQARSAARSEIAAIEAIVHEAPRPEGPLFEDLYVLYRDHHLLATDPKTGKPKLRSGAVVARHIERVHLPVWRGIVGTEITRTHIVDLVVARKQVRPNPAFGQGQGQREWIGGKCAAVATFRVTHAMFAWFYDPPAEVSREPLLPSNPCPKRGLRIHGVTPEELKRTVLLETASKLRSFWYAALHLPRPASQLFRVSLLNGQRRSQFAKLERHQIEDMVIHFDRDVMKMNESHLLPLTRITQDILNELPFFEGSRYIFTHDGKFPFNSFALYKEKIDELSGLSGWVIHDLRRTLRSHMSALRFPDGRKIEDKVSEMILAHKRKGVEGIYDMYKCLPEMREDLELWQQHLMRILRGELDLDLAV